LKQEDQQDYISTKAFEEDEINGTDIFNSMQVQQVCSLHRKNHTRTKKDINTNLTNLKMQVDSRYMTIENNTSIVSGKATSENEITDIWNPLDDSFTEQSDQTMKEYDERNGSQELTDNIFPNAKR